MKLLLYSVAYTIYIAPLFFMATTLKWCKATGYVTLWFSNLEKAYLVVFLLGFYGVLYWYCLKLKEIEI